LRQKPAPPERRKECVSWESSYGLECPYKRSPAGRRVKSEARRFCCPFWPTPALAAKSTQKDYNWALVDPVNLTHHFLIAMPGMADPNFSRTLTYICEHSIAEGAMGLVVNRPIDMTVSSLLERLNLEPGPDDAGTAPVYYGGPVQTD